LAHYLRMDKLEKPITRRSALQAIGATFINAPAFLGLGASATALITGGCQSPVKQKPRHIVMISIDDLNDYVGFLRGYQGDAHTPQLDALAASGRSYLNAHVCAPVCMPSRAAALFGKRPDTTGIYGHGGAFQATPPPASDFGKYRAMLSNPAVKSLPQMVKAYASPNYTTMSMGKVFHSARPEQWDIQQPFRELSEIYSSYPSDSADLFSYGVLPPGDTHQDQLTADWASSIFAEAQDEPIFMALGFYQPHPPWRLPQWAFDLHPIESIVIPEYIPDDLADVPPLGQEMAKQPWSAIFGSNFELVRAQDTQKQILQAYLAATSHTDYLVGQVIRAIEKGPNSDRTDIILWSDNGYHLGEKLHFRKATLWEKSTRVPLIIRSPITSPGETVTAAVSLVDLVPTVIEMAGGDPAEVIDEEKLDGASLFGTNPSRAVSYWEGAKSIRSGRWRYTLYPDGTEELYDHRNDPNEYVNLAQMEESLAVLTQLRPLV
jgi:iduronate 2-sulfatase